MELIAGNWKMYHGGRDSLQLIESLLEKLIAPLPGEVVVCPPATALFMVGDRVEDTPLQLGCQNFFYENEGAFTGEIAPIFAREAGVSYAIIGHSERRALFGEGPEINRKVQAALQAEITPILCVGEQLAEREDGRAWPVVLEQLREGLQGLPPEKLAGLAVAYEPVWAIGTGQSASPEDARYMAARIREELKAVSELRVLYGGSVKPDNVDGFMDLEEIDGALVGGASLKAETFARLIYREKKG